LIVLLAAVAAIAWLIAFEPVKFALLQVWTPSPTMTFVALLVAQS
jgi:hypothetical protein